MGINRLLLPVGRDWSPELESELTQISDPVWVFEPESKNVLWANQAAVAFWKANSLQALLERDFANSLTSVGMARVRRHRAQLKKNEVASDRWTFFPLDGPGVTLDALLVPVTAADGRPALLVRAESTDTEATTREGRGVEALRHTGMMVTMCTPAGQMLMENEAAQEVYGYSSQAPADGITARFADETEARRIRAALERGLSLSREIQVRTRMGLRWHTVSINSTVDPVTDAACFIIDEQDVTQRKAHEVALETSRYVLESAVQDRTQELATERDNFEQVFDVVGALIFVADAQGTILRANQWAQSIFPSRTLIGSNVCDVCGFPTRENLSQWVSLGTPQFDPVEVVLQLPGTNKRHILWMPRLSKDAAGQTRLFLSGLDVTELRDAESQLQVTDRVATMGTLAAGIAHDLNNPLAYVTASAEVLLEEIAMLPGRDDLAAMARDCLEGARRAATIVSQLQTFARGSTDGTNGVANISSVVEFAARMADNQVKHKAHIEVHCPPELTVAMEESKLGMVVLNLLVHATDNMEPGDASRHRVLIEAVAAEEGWVKIRVEDDGPGLSAEELRKIFDPYSSSHTPPRGMTGLGLAISQRLIAEANGRVEVQSTQGQGTRVVVWLPVPASNRPSARVGATPKTSAAAATTPKATILIVDDEDKLRSVIRRALSRYDVHEAVHGRQALERIADRQYDLILCDIMMPEMTGVELFAVLTEENPAQAQRMVFLSGGAFTSSAGDFLALTKQPIVDKPFRIDTLRTAVREALQRFADKDVDKMPCTHGTAP